MPSIGLCTCVLVCCAVSYAVCGIPFGKIFAQRMSGIDLQKVGSGNIGTTNALRAGGPKVAILTLAFDCLKGVFGVLLGRWIIGAFGFGLDASVTDPGAPGDFALSLVALACLYGHIFSPYLKFKGGKGIATGVGILFGFYWPLALVHLGIFIIVVALTKYVSLGSIITAGLVPFTVYLVFPETSLPALAIWALLGWTVVWAHRGNIRRLASRSEAKLSFSKRVTKMDGEE